MHYEHGTDRALYQGGCPPPGHSTAAVFSLQTRSIPGCMSMRAQHRRSAFAQANLTRTLDPEDSALEEGNGSDRSPRTYGRWIRQGSTLVVLDVEPLAPAPARSRRDL